MIPKKIYQTWYTKKIPDKIKQSTDNMMKINSSYEYYLFDDSDIYDFIKNNFDRQTLLAYEQLNIGAAKADLWRYLILYKNGGVYLDLDSEITSNLDLLITSSDKAIISREKNHGLFVQWCMMFEKDHPILEKTIQKCIFNIRTKKTEDILFLTGPQVYSSCILEVLNPLNIDIYNSSDEVINSLMNNQNFNKIKTKVYSYDYNNFCLFKGKNCHLLDYEKINWREESKIKSIFNF